MFMPHFLNLLMCCVDNNSKIHCDVNKLALHQRPLHFVQCTSSSRPSCVRGTFIFQKAFQPASLLACSVHQFDRSISLLHPPTPPTPRSGKVYRAFPVFSFTEGCLGLLQVHRNNKALTRDWQS